MTDNMTPAERKPLVKINDDIVYFRHQVEGVRQMAKMTGALLGDEMGLGKSLQALTVAAIAWEKDGIARILVVSPASLKGNWGDEIEKMTSFTYAILPSGKSKEKRSQFLADWDAAPTDILIVNYEQVIAHFRELNDLGFGMVIYDEAHMLKSKKSARTKACKKLAAPRHFLLTGSPLLNQVDDLWSLLNRIDPAEWSSFWNFLNRYATYGGWMNKQIVGVKNEKELRERLQRYMIRRSKKDCLDLPDKQYITIKLDLLPEQRKLYDQAKDEMQIDMPDDASPFEISNQLVKVLRLKQICGTTASIPGHPDVSIKLDVAVEKIKELLDNGEPVVVFTQFRATLQCLNARLEAAGIPWWTLHGDIKAEQRKPIVDEWTRAAEAGKFGVISGTYKVAGTGLTMTAARTMIRLDKDYAPKINEQAEDRLHRIGQRRTVTIIDLIARNTYDATIEKIVQQKTEIFDGVVETDNSDWRRRLIAALAESELEDEESAA